MEKNDLNVAQRIVNAIRDEFDYTIPIDPKDEFEGLILNYIFSERDSEKMNKMVCCLLNLNDKGIKDAIWRSFPLNFENYKLCPELEAFVQKRAAILEECFHRDGNICNKTPDIFFELGRITPVRKKHKFLIRTAIRLEMKNDLSKKEHFELECIKSWVEEGNCNGAEALSFVVLNSDESLVGYIKVSKGGYFTLRDNVETYNLEYYTLPGHRKKGYMKGALRAFMQAVSDGKIQYYTNDPMLNYDNKPRRLPLKILNAVIETSNLSSIKTIEAVDGFEKQNVIRWASDHDENWDVVMDEAVVFTRVF